METVYIVCGTDEELIERYTTYWGHKQPLEDDVEVICFDGLSPEDALYRGIQIGQRSSVFVIFDSMSDAVAHVKKILNWK